MRFQINDVDKFKDGDRFKNKDMFNDVIEFNEARWLKMDWLKNTDRFKMRIGWKKRISLKLGIWLKRTNISDYYTSSAWTHESFSGSDISQLLRCQACVFRSCGFQNLEQTDYHVSCCHYLNSDRLRMKLGPDNAKISYDKLFTSTAYVQNINLLVSTFD